LDLIALTRFAAIAASNNLYFKVCNHLSLSDTISWQTESFP